MTETLLLGKTEEWFWESTPKTVMALIDQKNQIEKIKMKNQAVYIACMVWGKDPDEFENNADGLVAGRDRPIDPSALNCLFM